jgi:hypothetical protein
MIVARQPFERTVQDFLSAQQKNSARKLEARIAENVVKLLERE